MPRLITPPIDANPETARIVVLNGPLGIGKSTLAEQLSESIESCVNLDGDAVVSVNPPPDDPVALLHSSLAILLPHYRAAGYRHFVVNHIWETPAQLAALRLAVDPANEALFRVFLLTLPLEDNLRRVGNRRLARISDEADFEQATLFRERDQLYSQPPERLGEPFDVSGAPADLVAKLKLQLGL